MPWLISDANIIIDMDVGGVLEHMFRLPEIFAVPDILYVEELETHHPHLPGLGLQVKKLSAVSIAEVYRLIEVYSEPSRNDMFALSLAKQEDCPLLTGDQRLREAAVAEEVEVNGTLWLVKRMFEESVLSIDQVEIAYERMKKEKRWLPWAEVNRQVKEMK